MEKSKEEIKADELIEMFHQVESPYDDNVWGINLTMAKQCAIKCVSVIISETKPDLGFDFWQKVKQILIDKQK